MLCREKTKNQLSLSIDWGEHGVGDAYNYDLFKAVATVRAIAEGILEKGRKEKNGELSGRKNFYRNSHHTLVQGLSFFSSTKAAIPRINSHFETPWSMDELMVHKENDVFIDWPSTIADLFLQELNKNGFVIEYHPLNFRFNVISIKGIPVKKAIGRPEEFFYTCSSAQTAIKKAEAQFTERYQKEKTDEKEELKKGQC
jgi:hypothetical protein